MSFLLIIISYLRRYLYDAVVPFIIHKNQKIVLFQMIFLFLFISIISDFLSKFSPFLLHNFAMNFHFSSLGIIILYIKIFVFTFWKFVLIRRSQFHQIIIYIAIAEMVYSKNAMTQIQQMGNWLISVNIGTIAVQIIGQTWKSSPSEKIPHK